MQKRAAIWITRAFCMSFTAGIEAIAGLIPIYLYMQKLYSYILLRAYLLPQNHIINSLLETRNPIVQESHQLLLNNLMFKQQSSIKGPIINMDNKLNEVFLSFSPFNSKFLLENRLIDIFLNCFSFHLSNRSNNQDIKSHLRSFNNISI